MTCIAYNLAILFLEMPSREIYHVSGDMYGDVSFNHSLIATTKAGRATFPLLPHILIFVFG